MDEPHYDIDRSPTKARIQLLGTRVVLLFADTFVKLQKSIEAELDDEANALFYEAGINVGKNSTRLQLNAWPERNMAFLRKQGAFYGSRGVGWFNLKELHIDWSDENAYIRTTESFIAEKYGPTDKPVCHFLAGFFVGTLEEAFHVKVSSEETQCTAKGDPCCEFRFERI
jgi:predicted hydrocarbon binding protein